MKKWAYLFLILLIIITACNENEEIVLTRQGVFETISIGEGRTIEKIEIFYSSDCEDCKEIIGNILPAAAKKYNKKFEIRKFDILKIENMERLMELEEKLGREYTDMPAVYINGTIIDGLEDIKKYYLRK